MKGEKGEKGMKGDPRPAERDLFEHFGVDRPPVPLDHPRAASECRPCPACGWFVKLDEELCTICGRHVAEAERR